MTVGTKDRGGVRPVPDATRFQRRIERPSRGRQTWTTVPQWATLTAGELDVLPVGTRRSVRFLPGVYVGLIRTEHGWTLLRRCGIPSEALTDLRSAPRVPIDPEPEQ